MSDETRESRRFGWPLAFTVVSLAAILAAVWIFQSLRAIPGDVVDKGRELAADLRDLAESFHEGGARTEFVTYATRLSGGNRLQFGELDRLEVFRRTDYATTFWGNLALPDVVVEAQVPVRYTYYLDLEGEWEMTVEGDMVRVLAPPIEFNPPAANVSAIEFRVREDSLLRDEAAAVEKLRAGLTSMTRHRARELLESVRELGRRQTEAFVRTWLASRFDEPPSRYRIEVRFADEPGLTPDTKLERP